MNGTGTICVLIVLAAAWLLAVRGRHNPEQLRNFYGWVYAHRGFHNRKDAPENSAEAFRRAVEKGFGSELDVHLLSDGGLAVVHDSNLKRVTGREIIVEDLRTEDLAEYSLLGTEQTIPTLRQVLDIYDGKAPLIIELKTWKKNDRALCEAVSRELEGYKGLYCIESFDPRAVRWYRKNRPSVVRGQLCANFLKNPGNLGIPEAFVATFLLTDFLTRPDFIAYKYADRGNLSNRICLHLWKMTGVSWTLRSEREMETAKKEGLLPIFEGFDPGKP